MKKLFTTFLLMGVALFSWGQSPSYSFTNGVLTVPYDSELPNDPEGIKNYIVNKIDGLNAFPTTVETLKLVGGFTNADFAKDKIVHKLVHACSKPETTINLDLSACEDLVSTVTYTSTETNPVKNPVFLPDPNNPETQDVTRTIDGLTKTTAYWMWNNEYDNADWTSVYNEGNLYQDADGIWHRRDWGNQIVNIITKDAYIDANNNVINVPEGATLTQNANGTWTCSYTETITLDATRFTIAKEYGERLKGISFPNGSNFTAITNNLCNTLICPNLESVVFGDNLKWIGDNAFRGGVNHDGHYSPASKLKYINGSTVAGVVTFPQTLEVIGMDAFYECTQFTSVNLNLPNLVKVDAAAFNMYQDDANNLTTVILPTSDNTSLKFWGNQVFSSSHVATLDFRHCLGIKHFAYDGTNSMEEGTFNPLGDGANGSNTFYWHQYMTTLVLPPNLEYVAGGDNANVGMTKECWRLETIEFTGKGIYDSNCELTNPLTISKSAFKYSDPVDQENYGGSEFYNIGEFQGNTSKLRLLKNVILSDNIVRICTDAFANTSIETIAIPASVQVIENHAFSECRLLTTVIFDDIRENCDCDPYPTRICGDDNGQGQGAFNNCSAVTDVYINTSALLDCQNNAFDAANTWGRGDAGRSFATLHFPIENIENYVNLKHALTDMEAADPDLFHDWLMDHYMLAGVPNMNGWYEFINSGPSKGKNDPGTQDIILQTFSDWNYSYLVPDGLRAYIVNEIGKEGDNYVLTLKRLQAIPAKTGVILYGHPNGKTQAGNPTLALTPVQFAKKDDVVEVGGHTYTLEYDQGQPLSRDNWESPGYPEGFKNYLEPTSSPSTADVDRIASKITSLTNKIAETEDADEKSKLQEQLATATAEKTYLEALMAAHPEWKNSANGEYKGGRYVKPFENLNDNDPFKVVPATSDIAFRNFAMSRYSKTHNLAKSDDGKLKDGDDDYEAFFRMIAGYYPTGKAFLRLSDAEYDQQTGAEILVKKDEGDVTYHHEMNTGKSQIGGINPGDLFDARQVAALNPNGWWNAAHGFDWDIANPSFTYTDENDNEITAKRMNWGQRPTRFQPNPSLPNHAPIYYGEIGEETDGIVKLVIPADVVTNGEYYTLQGVKVAKPTKGVYIRGGKKVIIK